MSTTKRLAPTQVDIIKKTEEFVRDKLSGDSSGHDWWHIYRVWQNARQIAQHEDVDCFVVELAALLHDIADWKFNGGDLQAGSRVARQWLESQAVDESVISHVCQIISTLSYKGAGASSEMSTPEGRVTQDADRLESMGATGIARTFAYGGHKGRPIYDPNATPEKHDTFEQYKNSNGPSINHFFEKLLLLQDLLNTETAKTIGKGRHEFMKAYLEQFFAEWNGRA